ncbi:MAG: hypothetical protein MUO62_02475 [Anaerolineales bacterium]|nr:hypothetical protein [Anaerolineales bacterium]
MIASGWGVAVITHAVHNTIITLATGAGGLFFGTFLDWSGLLIMFFFILWAIHREKNWIKTHLLEEIAFGSITHAQYRTASSAWAQNLARFNALSSGKYWATHRFYHLTANLAYKKEQLARMGEEKGNTAKIAVLRAEIRELGNRLRS